MITEIGKNWKEILEKERIAVVKCYGDWCGPCKFFSPHFQKYTETFNVYNDVEIKYYQSNNDKNRLFAKEYVVEKLPSIVFLVHGVMVYKIEGVSRQSVFEEVLQKALDVKFRIREGEQHGESATAN